jgi:hypothetical protein
MVIHHIHMVILNIDVGWDIDMGNDSIDSVILDIDMGYRITLTGPTMSRQFELFIQCLFFLVCVVQCTS